MDMRSIKRNILIKDLFTKKYKQRIVKPKKGKGSFKRKKIKEKFQDDNFIKSTKNGYEIN